MLGENPNFLKILGRIIFRLDRNPQLRRTLNLPPERGSVSRSNVHLRLGRGSVGL